MSTANKNQDTFDDLFVPPSVIDDDEFLGFMPEGTPEQPTMTDNPIYPSSSGSFIKKTNYSREELFFRKAFVEEFIKDRDAKAALMRLGRSNANATLLAPRLMAEQLVLTMIAEYKEEITDESHKTEQNIREDIVLTMRNIMADPNAKPSERVAAARLLVDLHGLTKVATTDDLQHNIMLVPFIDMQTEDALDTWAAKAQEMQRQLKVDVLAGID